MGTPTDDEKKALVAQVRFHLADPDEFLFKDILIRTALSMADWDGNGAVYRLLLREATTKSLRAKRMQFGNKTVEESPQDVLKMAEYYRSHIGDDMSDTPPLVSLHTDGEVGDGRSEFAKIGIEDVEEGLREDKNIKPRYGDGKTP